MRPLKDSYHHGALREALVVAATALVEEGGADSFSLRDAARTVGVTPSATYRHFENKGALLTAVAAAGVERLGKRMHRQLASAQRREGSPRAVATESFRDTCRAYCAFALQHPAIYRVMYGPAGLHELSRSCAEGVHGPHRILGSALDGLVTAGLLSKARRSGAEFRAWTVLHGFSTQVLDGVPAFSSAAKRTEALEDLLDFTVEGLLGRSAPRS